MKAIIILLFCGVVACQGQDISYNTLPYRSPTKADTSEYEFMMLTKKEAKIFKEWLKTLVDAREGTERFKVAKDAHKALYDSMGAFLAPFRGRVRDSLEATLFTPKLDSLWNEYLRLRDEQNAK